MRTVLILGAGKIGQLIATFFAHCEKTTAYLADVQDDAGRLDADVQYIKCDAQDERALAALFDKYNVDVVISALPYFCNLSVARVAREKSAHYFDLTEDTAVSAQIKTLAKDAKTAFVPQCGLAPGFISIVTNNLMRRFSTIDAVKMRVGALPMNPNNAFKYALTWSTDGLINAYGNLCHGIAEGKDIELIPLEGYETITLDGVLYEAFNTSGGLGTLTETYRGQVQSMNYKTLRYPGHCQMAKFLMNDLKLNHDRPTLKRILEAAVPRTEQDVVLIYVSVTGEYEGQFTEENYVKKIYPHKIYEQQWTAIQVSTAAGVCAVVDQVLEKKDKYSGFITQESFSFSDFLGNRFGGYYDDQGKQTG